jgi:hypothetical protein
MKMRRPWQPHMSNDQLFNPFVPPQERSWTLDHLEIAEEEHQEEGTDPAERSAEQKNDDEKPAG